MKKQQVKRTKDKKDNNIVRKDNKRKKNKIIEFLNQATPIIIVLVILDIVMLMYIVSYTKGNGIRVGYYTDEEITISNVHYFINGKNNYFYASNATYTGKEKTVYSYITGYYAVTKDGKYIPLVTRTNRIETGIDLATLLAVNTYSLSESNKKEVFTKEVMENIDNIHFVFRASTEKDNDAFKINIDKKIELTKIIGE